MLNITKIKRKCFKIISPIFQIIPENLLIRTYQFFSKIKIFKILIKVFITFFIPEKVKIGNLFLFLNQKDAIVSGSIAMNIYESFETEIFIKNSTENSVIIDIGANIGYYTLLAASKARKVIAFEPDSESLFFLRKSIKYNNLKNIEVRTEAVTNREKLFINFYKNPYNQGDSRIYSFKEGTISNHEIQSTSIDYFVKQNNLEKIDLIKIDIQGAEGLALEGMQNLLTSQKPKLFIEFFPKGLRACGTDPIIFIKKLFSFGYNVYYINNQSKSLDNIKNVDSFVLKFNNIDYCNLFCN